MSATAIAIGIVALTQIVIIVMVFGALARTADILRLISGIVELIKLVNATLAHILDNIHARRTIDELDNDIERLVNTVDELGEE